MINVQPNAIATHWVAVMQGLAGALPGAYWGPDDGAYAYREREAMKAEAGQWRDHYSFPAHAALRAPYWVLHAYAHWWRAWLALSKAWDADDYDAAFPGGIRFRRYLGAWMYSVGVTKLGMTAADVEAVHEMTGVALLPHELLPAGYSEFRREPVAVRAPSLDEVLAASADSKA